MHLDLWVVLGSLIVGVAVGLTGMGGGALMTPVLVLIFGVQPLAAVSSDLVASFVMKPVGGIVHVRSRTVQWPIVGWLSLGSVPAAFLGAVFLHTLAQGHAVQHVIEMALGAALLVAAAAIAGREFLLRLRGNVAAQRWRPKTVRARPALTLAVGAIGGFIVGVTSVGSGSLMMVCLLVLYPSLRAREVVGTDLVQAIPLVGAAALGHILYGNLQVGVTAAVIMGSVPGTYLGAKVSVRASGRFIRPILALVLFATALKLLEVDVTVLVGVAGSGVLGIGAYAAVRRPWVRPIVTPDVSPDALVAGSQVPAPVGS